MKKAQIEVSFNWIFVLIAGFAILMFFFMLINNQTDSSQEELARTTTDRLSNIFESIQSNPDTAQEHPRANYELTFSCIGGVHEFRQGQSTSSAYLENSIVFTPRTMGNSQLLTLTKRENLPFLTTSTLFLTDKNTHYVFGTGMAAYNNLLPDIFSKVNGDYPNAIIAAQNYRRVIYVISSNEPTPTPAIANIDVIKINNADGQIIFEDETLKFFSQEMALGAIISGNYELTKCNFDKINQSFERMKTILIQRKDMISNELTGNCEVLLDSTDIDLSFNDDASTFTTKSNNLEERNRELERLGCPIIY